MKSFKLIYLIGTLQFIFHTNINAIDNVITFFINHAPIEKTNKIDSYPIESVSKKLMQPRYLFGTSNKESLIEPRGFNGINAMYIGYVTTSNKNGQLSFPRKQQTDEIHLLITPKILPLFMIAPSLIYGWNIDTSQPMAMYQINRKKHTKLDTYYFDIKNINDIINDSATDDETKMKYKKILDGTNAIPFNTVTLIADPENIQVPQGISLNHYSPNFILPTLTAKDVKTTEHSLYTLTIKQYFEQINIESKSESSKIATIIANQ